MFQSDGAAASKGGGGGGYPAVVAEEIDFWILVCHSVFARIPVLLARTGPKRQRQRKQSCKRQRLCRALQLGRYATVLSKFPASSSNISARTRVRVCICVKHFASLCRLPKELACGLRQNQRSAGSRRAERWRFAFASLCVFQLFDQTSRFSRFTTYRRMLWQCWTK